MSSLNIDTNVHISLFGNIQYSSAYKTRDMASCVSDKTSRDLNKYLCEPRGREGRQKHGIMMFVFMKFMTLGDSRTKQCSVPSLPPYRYLYM